MSVNIRTPPVQLGAAILCIRFLIQLLLLQLPVLTILELVSLILGQLLFSKHLELLLHAASLDAASHIASQHPTAALILLLLVFFFQWLLLLYSSKDSLFIETKGTGCCGCRSSSSPRSSPSDPVDSPVGPPESSSTNM